MVEIGPDFLPKLKENVFHIYPDMERANLITLQGTYNLPTTAALAFLKMRSFCTGHHSVTQIARKSGFTVEQVIACLNSLKSSGIIYSSTQTNNAGETGSEIRNKLLKTTLLWADELKHSYIGNEFVSGKLPREALIGWLLEMYHYIMDFPEAIQAAADASSGTLKFILEKFAREERGHEIFVVKTLVNLGLSVKEIESSHPMLSTRMIGFVMRDMFSLEPSTVLLLAALVEAQEFDEDQIGIFKQKLDDYYKIGARSFDPYFDHQRIDFNLGHAKMLEDNLDLLNVSNPSLLDGMVNKLHDVKHAFDLQGAEIRSYYGDLNGKYVPRQPINYSDI